MVARHYMIAGYGNLNICYLLSHISFTQGLKWSRPDKSFYTIDACDKYQRILCKNNPFANTVTRGDTAKSIIGRPNTKVCDGEITDQLENTKLIGELPVCL